MKLIKQIPLKDLQISLNQLALEFPQFVIVLSQDQVKIYKQVR